MRTTVRKLIGQDLATEDLEYAIESYSILFDGPVPSIDELGIGRSTLHYSGKNQEATRYSRSTVRFETSLT